MKKSVIVFLALCMLLGLCACSDKPPEENPFQTVTTQPAAPPGQPQITLIEAPSGFCEQMVTNTGLLPGVQTPEDIAAMFGEPDNITVTTYSAGEIVRYEYPFGAFEFEGTLYYIEGFAGLLGPQGITAGMTLNEVVERLCAGSSAKLDGSGEVLLYGNEDGDYGKFSRLTEEFVGENGCYQLDCRAITAGGKYKLTVNFDRNMNMTVFLLQLS